MAKYFSVSIGLCKLLFLCGSRTIKTSLRLTFFLLLHKANNTCISLKRYLSLACMCSILSILALKGFLERAPHFIYFATTSLRKSALSVWPSKTITKTGFLTIFLMQLLPWTLPTPNWFWILPVPYAAISCSFQWLVSLAVCQQKLFISQLSNTLPFLTR